MQGSPCIPVALPGKHGVWLLSSKATSEVGCGQYMWDCWSRRLFCFEAVNCLPNRTASFSYLFIQRSWAVWCGQLRCWCVGGTRGCVCVRHTGVVVWLLTDADVRCLLARGMPCVLAPSCSWYVVDVPGAFSWGRFMPGVSPCAMPVGRDNLQALS
jgi:hypothetical protein